jgi:hypothetical protein
MHAADVELVPQHSTLIEYTNLVDSRGILPLLYLFIASLAEFFFFLVQNLSGYHPNHATIWSRKARQRWIVSRFSVPIHIPATSLSLSLERLTVTTSDRVEKPKVLHSTGWCLSACQCAERYKFSIIYSIHSFVMLEGWLLSSCAKPSISLMITLH